jgi:hypothetical protein
MLNKWLIIVERIVDVANNNTEIRELISGAVQPLKFIEHQLLRTLL